MDLKNFSFPMNGTNMNVSLIVYFMSQVENLFIGTAVAEIACIIVGALLNLWFLAAILSSPEMRSRMRNKAICNILILHLLDCFIIMPMFVAKLINFKLDCYFQTGLINLQLIQDFVANWLLVILIAVYLAQVISFDPKAVFTPLAINIGTYLLLVLPWLLSVIIVPVALYFDNVRHFSRFSLFQKGCLLRRLQVHQIFKTVDAITPIVVMIVLLVTAAILRYRRFTRGRISGAVQTELINRGPQIDSTYVYIIAVIIAILCDVMMLLSVYLLLLSIYVPIFWFHIKTISFALNDGRVILMALPWLLLPDIRERIKIWRPWYRPAPGIDVTVTYRKDIA